MHTKIPHHRVPSNYMAKGGFPTSSDPDTVDVVFSDLYVLLQNVQFRAPASTDNPVSSRTCCRSSAPATTRAWSRRTFRPTSRRRTSCCPMCRRCGRPISTTVRYRGRRQKIELLYSILEKELAKDSGQSLGESPIEHVVSGPASLLGEASYTCLTSYSRCRVVRIAAHPTEVAVTRVQQNASRDEKA